LENTDASLGENRDAYHLFNTSWFIRRLYRKIETFAENGELDYAKYPAGHDYRRLMEKAQNGFYVNFDYLAESGVFAEYRAGQIFLIAFGLWYGIDKFTLMDFMEPEMSEGDMETLLRLFYADTPHEKIEEWSKKLAYVNPLARLFGQDTEGDDKL
jgi:hypothetical protein